MGWTGPRVLGELIGAAALLVTFVLVELRVTFPMFPVRLFRVRAFAAAVAANLCASIGRGGLMFLMVIWLQGVWLPLNGYAFATTPLWAAVHMLPFVGGLVATGPLAGILTDRVGARPFAVAGQLVAAGCFVWMGFLAFDFSYLQFAVLLFVMGCGQALFISPNRAATMGSLPVTQRGAGSGMMATAQNTGQVLAVGGFFTLLIVGLAAGLPAAMRAGLQAHGVPPPVAVRLSSESPTSLLFAAFLGYNPLHALLGGHLLATLGPARAGAVTARTYFPRLIGGPLEAGIRLTAVLGSATALLAAAMSWWAGGKEAAALHHELSPADPAAHRRLAVPAGGTVPRG